MAAHYDFYKNPPSQKTPKKVRLHPRVVTRNTTTPQELATLVQDRCSATTADVSLVLDSLRSVLIQQIKMGNRVHFEGLGYFMMTLTAEPVRDEHAIRAESVHFKSISFRPEAGLKKAFTGIRLERAPQKAHSATLTDEAIIDYLDNYFTTHQSISRSEFQALCGLQQTTAFTRLKSLVEKGILVKIGLHKFPAYVFADELR